MLKYILLLSLAALAKSAAAQHTELIGRAGASFFQYAGKDAAANSFINYSYVYHGRYAVAANNPFGRQLGAGFALGGRVQRVGLRQGLLAVDVGYDWVRSRTGITSLFYNNGYQVTTAYVADGSAYLRTQNLTLFLGLGHRFQLAPISLDALVGPEVASILSAHERGNGSYYSGYDWSSDNDRSLNTSVDVRLRADLTAWYQRVGLSASYSYGFSNYQRALLGASPEAYGRTLRLGLAYRLR